MTAIFGRVAAIFVHVLVTMHRCLWRQAARAEAIKERLVSRRNKVASLERKGARDRRHACGRKVSGRGEILATRLPYLDDPGAQTSILGRPSWRPPSVRGSTGCAQEVSGKVLAVMRSFRVFGADVESVLRKFLGKYGCSVPI